MRRRSSTISTNGERARSGDRIAIAAHLGGSDVFDQAITRTWQIIHHKEWMLVAYAIRARHACAIRWAEEY